ncbi:MAG: TetR/AcrR family transcriptional regulator [Cellvibrionales bacterium]|nr:TetR/AcrR family transcriptional regulator [Cellvibrionales bacterium]
MSARRERRAQEVKARMVNAGIELLANRELDAFSIEEICELADVAKKTFYNYFSNKEALFADLIQQLILKPIPIFLIELKSGTPALPTEFTMSWTKTSRCAEIMAKQKGATFALASKKFPKTASVFWVSMVFLKSIFSVGRSKGRRRVN